jgi:DNA polymerase III delta prime subunit
LFDIISGINVVRQTIKTFAQKKVTLPPGKHKIVILDEADNMTAGAQQTMRRTMEKVCLLIFLKLSHPLQQPVLNYNPFRSRLQSFHQNH